MERGKKLFDVFLDNFIFVHLFKCKIKIDLAHEKLLKSPKIYQITFFRNQDKIRKSYLMYFWIILYLFKCKIKNHFAHEKLLKSPKISSFSNYINLDIIYSF